MSERPKFPIGVNVFVIKDGKLLLGKRNNITGHGQWGLPGGHLEFEESMPEAAKRELKEETSLEADKMNFVGLANDNKSNNGHYVQVGFSPDNVRGEVRVMEPDCSEWQWFPLTSLPEEIFFGHKNQIELFLNKSLFGDSK